jgi:hypothetical protein
MDLDAREWNLVLDRWGPCETRVNRAVNPGMFGAGLLSDKSGLFDYHWPGHSHNQRIAHLRFPSVWREFG